MTRRHRSKRRGRRTRSGEPSTVIAAVVISLVCVVAVVAFGYWRINAVAPPELIAETLCPVYGPASITVVLIDSSDTIPEIGRKELQQYLSDMADGIDEYGLLELRLLEPGNNGGRILFNRCNPGNGANLSALTANPEMARRRWADLFKAPLGDALRSGLAPTGADTSPILATIQSIAVERFGGQAVANTPKRLVVISDMLEHGPDFSHYRSDADYLSFKASPAQRKFQTDLNQANVSIRYVDRPGLEIDSAQLIAFWSDWVSDNGGKLTDVERVQGAG